MDQVSLYYRCVAQIERARAEGIAIALMPMLLPLITAAKMPRL